MKGREDVGRPAMAAGEGERVRVSWPQGEVWKMGYMEDGRVLGVQGYCT